MKSNFLLRNISNIYFYSLHISNWKLNLTTEMKGRDTFWELMNYKIPKHITIRCTGTRRYF